MGAENTTEKPSRNILGMVEQGIGLASSIGGALLQNTRRKQQMADQRQLMELQQRNQMALNEQGQKIAQENWDYTNYENQVKHMKQAGLNPALMYGGSGPGGTLSSGSGGSASSGNAPTQDNSLGLMGIQLQQMANQNKLTEAQIANINEDTRKKGIEANKLAGADTDYTNMQTASLAQGIENAKANQKLTEMQTNLAGIEYDLKGATFEENVKILENEVKKGDKEIYILENQGQITHEEAINKKEEWKLKLIGMGLENGLTKLKQDLTSEQIKQIRQDVINSIKNTEANVSNARQNWRNANANQKNADTNFQSMLDNYNTKIKDILIKQGFLDNEELKTTMGAIMNLIGVGMGVAPTRTPIGY